VLPHSQKVKFFPSNTDTQSKAVQCLTKIPHPGPSRRLQKSTAWKSPPATAMTKLRVYAQACPSDAGGWATPHCWCTPIQTHPVGAAPRTLCRESPWVSTDGLAVTTSDVLHADASAQHHPPCNDFHTVATILCFKPSSQSSAKSQRFIHASSTKSCPKSQHPCSSHHITHRVGKAKDPLLSQGIKAANARSPGSGSSRADSANTFYMLEPVQDSAKPLL